MIMLAESSSSSLSVGEAERTRDNQRPEEDLSQEGPDLTLMFPPGLPLARVGEQTVGHRDRSWRPGCCNGLVYCEDFVRSIRIMPFWHSVHAQ